MKLEDIRSKIEVIQDNLDKLEKLRQLSFKEFVADFKNIDSAEHRLQTSIQALLDIGSYIISSLGLKAPDSNVEIMEILTEAGLLNKKRLNTYREMARFRNRIVHLYNQIDLNVLYQILKEELQDIKGLYRILITVVKKYK